MIEKIPIIYSLSDPETGEIRYVGKTQNELYKRLSGHWKDRRKDYKTHWINSLRKRGLKPIMSVLEICTQDNWEEREKFWIKHLRELGHKLTNWLEGGNSLPRGYKHSAETIEKIRESSKRQNKGKFQKGRKWESKQAEGNWKTILQYDLDGNFIKEWKGIINVVKALNINGNTLSLCYRKITKRAGNFQWRPYSENYPKQIEKYIHPSTKSGKYAKIFKNV